jgi:hypothetical protein
MYEDSSWDLVSLVRALILYYLDLINSYALIVVFYAYSIVSLPVLFLKDLSDCKK